MKTPILYLCILLLFLTEKVCGQSVSYNRYTTSDGLVSNMIYDMVLDDDDYLWLSTDNGIARYNGEEFEHFGFDDGLPDNEVLKLFKDSQNRVWALCYNGRVVVIENEKVTTKIGDIELETLESPTFYLNGYEGKNGNVFLTQWSNGAYMLNEDSVTHTMKGYAISCYFEKKGATYCVNRQSGPQIMDVWRVEDSKLDTSFMIDNFIYINTYGESEESLFFFGENDDRDQANIIVFDKNSSTLTYLPFAPGVQTKVNDMCVLGDLLYISTNEGFFEMNLNSNVVVKLHDQEFTKIIQDNQGNIWLGSLGRGLSVIETNTNLKKTIVGSNVESMYYDEAHHELIYGTSSTINKWNLATNSLSEKKIEGTLRLYDILVDGDHTYYCFNDRLVHEHRGKLTPTSFSSKQIAKDLYSDSLIIGSSFGLAKCLNSDEIINNREHFVSEQKIRALAIAQLSLDHILVGSSDRLYHYKNGKFKRDSLVDTRVNALYIGKDGNPLCISEIDGVIHLKDHEMVLLNSEFDNPIGKITASTYKEDTLWLATEYGIHYLTEVSDKWQSKSYAYDSDITDQKVNDILKIGSKLYLGTYKGILTFDPSQYQKDSYSAKLKIKEISINSKQYSNSKYLDLRADQNNIVIQLEVHKFLRSKVKFYYSLDDGSTWQITTQPQLVFANLSPDDYQLKIYAQEQSGLKSNDLTMTMSISPPFYNSLPFYVITTSFLLFLTYGIYKFKLNRVRRDSKIERQLASSQQKALRAQMNPHFLFNALNSIQQFFLEDNDLDGQEYISKFSRLVRNSLDNSEKDLQLINDELENLKRYVELEQLRLNHSFSYTTVIDQKVNVYATYIPSMILQPIVENSIWHGIQHLQDTSGKIVVKIRVLKEKRLEISVSDNGVGRKKSAEINKSRSHISQGTSLINQRVIAINGARNIDIDIRTINNQPQGTIVTIQIPVIDEYTHSR